MLALIAGSVRRFRAIVLTSITTCAGMLPMVLERSVDATFMAPMAVSLGLGVLTSTLATLYLTPIVYVRLYRTPTERS